MEVEAGMRRWSFDWIRGNGRGMVRGVDRLSEV